MMIFLEVLLLALVNGRGHRAEFSSGEGSMYESTVETVYGSNSSIPAVRLQFRLDQGNRTYFKETNRSEVVIEWLDYESKANKLWVSGLSQVLVAPIPKFKLPKVTLKYKDQPRNGKPTLVCGVQCYKRVSTNEPYGLQFVEWVNAADKHDSVVSLTYRNGKLVDSVVQLERRKAKPEDMQLFAFPKGLKEVKSSYAKMSEWRSRIDIDPSLHIGDEPGK